MRVSQAMMTSVPDRHDLFISFKKYHLYHFPSRRHSFYKSVMRELSESQLELQLLDYLVRVRKILAWKNPTTGYFDPKLKRFRKHQNPYTRNGVPDILCVIEGRFLGLEVKTKKNSQSESQKAFEIDLRKALGHYYVVRSLEDVERALSEFQRSSVPFS